VKGAWAAAILVGFYVGSSPPAGAYEPRLGVPAGPPADCSVPLEMTQLETQLPNTARAIRNREALSIVAIGSSSTEGVGASNQQNTNPAQLAAELTRRWPQRAIAVVNKGVGGEDAQQMLDRFERDVLPFRPHLVIWQVGSNYTLRHSDLDAYADVIRKGIRRLKAARADVVLMDMQYAPKVLARPLHRRMIETMSAIARDTKVAIFHRFAVMQHWVTSGRFGMEDIISRDRLHMNDTSYRCIGRLLAGSVTAAARASLVSPAAGAAAARGGVSVAGTGQPRDPSR
jgi:lysophospholipase L1-like esterase